MQLAIYKLEDDSKPLCVLSEGEHSLGRGTQLDCSDKRISRNHISIVIINTNATFSLIHHTNPCYWKCADSNHIVLLKPNSPMEINNGDTFGFFPDIHWFKIKHCEPGINNVADNTPTSSTTNIIATSSQNAQAQEANEEEVGTNSMLEQVKIEEQQENASGTSSIVEENECHSTTSDTNADNAQKAKINEVANSNTDDASANPTTTSNSADNKPSCSNTSQKKVFRDRCWYGANCYRKNSKHRNEYSHPDDPDYDTDPEDDRPACPFGRNCYRRNGDHRKNCKHSLLAKTAIPTTTTTNGAAAAAANDGNGNGDDNEEEDDAGGVNAANILNNKRKRKPRQPKTKPKKAKGDGEDAGDEDDEYESDFIDDEPFDTDEDDDYVMSDSASDNE